MTEEDFEKYREVYVKKIQDLILGICDDIRDPRLIMTMMADISLSLLETLVKLTSLETAAVLLNMWLKDKK